MRTVRAFSLVELLVVIAVIVILAALLLPVVSKAKGKTKTVACLSNLKQWGLATQLFVSENRDLLPHDGSPTPGNSATNFGWYIQLPQMLGLPRYHDMPWRTNSNADLGRTIWICPSNPRRSNTNNLFHYCLNSHVNDGGVDTGFGKQIMISRIPKPSATVWLFDNGGLAAVAQQNNVHSNLHSAGANFTFLDGHAARFRNRDYWNFATSTGLTGNPNLIWIPN